MPLAKVIDELEAVVDYWQVRLTKTKGRGQDRKRNAQTDGQKISLVGP